MDDLETLAIILDIGLLFCLLFNVLYIWSIGRIAKSKMGFILFLLLHPYKLHEMREEHKAKGCPICKEDELKWSTTKGG